MRGWHHIEDDLDVRGDWIAAIDWDARWLEVGS